MIIFLMGRLLKSVKMKDNLKKKNSSKQTSINQGGHAVQQLLLF